MKVCLITFSDNADHQNVVYSMFEAMNGKADVYTVGIVNPKSNIAPHTNRNFYYKCPKRPGISKESFRINVLLDIARMIRDNKIDILYFESQHLWNAMLMAICPKCKTIVAVHDVIPHDGNMAMDLSNFVTCHMSRHIVLRNKKYCHELSARYHISQKKITCIDLWRHWPQYKKQTPSGIYLYFGRIRRYKGLDLLVQIIEKTPEVQFKIVGDPDEESKPLVEKIKEYKNTIVIDREVTDEEMELLFSEASWIILPYAAATQSGVIVDAYKFSRPVIAFNVGAISEQIQNGVTGYLVTEGSVESFANTISQTYMLTPEELETISLNAYEFGKKKYSAESACNLLMTLFKNILKK